MMDSFVFPGVTTRVIFGSGTSSQIPYEIERLGHRRVLVLSTQGQADQAKAVTASLGDRAGGLFSEAEMHTPIATTERAVEVLESVKATAVISLGGGSTIGLGKAIAVRTGVDQVVIPTSYAGSEMTDILGETRNGIKTTRRSPDIRPETVIYDVDLTLSLPVQMSATSAMNAVAHAMEALYAPDRNPVIELLCKEALVAFRDSIPALLGDPRNLPARTKALFAAWCCSTALGHVSMALHHKLAHVLGGAFEAPHAETHAILLPYTAAYNEVEVSGLLKPLCEIFGGETASAGIWDFARTIGAPQSLRDIGVAQIDLDRAAEIAVKNPYYNPRPIDRMSIRALLQAAWEGARPTT